MNEPIDWQAREQRALEWLKLWREEREKALKERRPMRYIRYDYAAASAAGANTQIKTGSEL